MIDADVGTVGDDDLPPAKPVARVIVAEGELPRVASGRGKIGDEGGFDAGRVQPGLTGDERQRLRGRSQGELGRASEEVERGRDLGELASEVRLALRAGDRAVPIAIEQRSVGHGRQLGQIEHVDQTRLGPCRSRSGCTG